MVNQLNQLNRVGIPSGSQRGRVYGLRFRDLWKSGADYLGFEYERTGSLAGYAASAAIPENLLPVHKRMRRCVIDSDGVLQYYLDADNSMWKDGSAVAQSVANADGTVESMVDNYGLGTIVITPAEGSAAVDPAKVGCVMNIFDGASANFWYAIIIAADAELGTYTLSHPHITGWGTVGAEETAYYMIGDAKLDGSDGQVMVEIPGFWHKHSYEPSDDDDADLFKFLGWQQHDISLSPIKGGTYYPKRYVSAFEGVAGNSGGSAYNGWTGAYTVDELSGNVTWASPATASVPHQIMSVAGYYPYTYYSLDNFRSKCAATGTGYHQYDFASNFIIQLLMIIEHGTLHTQSRIGPGISGVTSAEWSTYNGYRSLRKTGDTIPAGNKSWNMATLFQGMRINAQQYNIQSVSYRGIENPYGHIFKWVDGFTFINNVPAEGSMYYTGYAHKAIDGMALVPGQLASHGSHAAAQADLNYRALVGLDGQPLKITNTSRYWKQVSPNLMPADNAESSSSYCYDYFYYGNVGDNVSRAFAVGGSADTGVLAGAFCVYSIYGSGNALNYYGGRLCKIG